MATGAHGSSERRPQCYGTRCEAVTPCSGELACSCASRASPMPADNLRLRGRSASREERLERRPRQLTCSQWPRARSLRRGAPPLREPWRLPQATCTACAAGDPAASSSTASSSAAYSAFNSSLASRHKGFRATRLCRWLATQRPSVASADFILAPWKPM